MNYHLILRTGLITALVVLGCTDDGEAETSSSETSGDGDGDGDSGDGDGDSGDGDGDGDSGDGDGDGDSGDGDGDEACPELPPEAEGSVSLGFGDLELQPGATHDFNVGYAECCYFFNPLDETCASYSIEPADAGATLDPETGFMTLDEDVADGTTYTITVEYGEYMASQDVFVYVPELHPLKGSYTEVARIPCDDGPEYVPTDIIGELRFMASGDFNVTWQPFELYVDYWGTYTHDLDLDTLSLVPLDGNYLPDDVDGEGSFSIEGDQLVLHDIWLGSSFDGLEPPACGHRFE